MSFEKTVKLATKPKAAPPKAKYVDPIITATYSNDGAIHDICRALGGRLREPNSVVVFKALIVLHQMIRSGSTDNVLTYLSKSAGGPGDVLRLRNVVGQTWDGYTPPANLGYYAQYLESRIRGYRELKHDPVRVQSESNRLSNYEGSSGKARKLRALTVDKGLLRETKQVQRMVDSLVQCKFYEDHLEDECTVTALRMMVKDLLVLTQAVNEGVINVLEHYFEMSKVDATEALAVYKAFCKQSDKVVEYLGMARKLHQLLDVPVPNLKHAPVSLVAALEEYLNDPNFENNRLEYKRNMAIADGRPAPAASSSATTTTSATASKPAEQPKPTQTDTASAPPVQHEVTKSIQDFFTSIESEQGQSQQQSPQFNMPMNTGSHPGMPNPFRQSMMFPQATGFPQQQMPLQPQFTASPWGQQGPGMIQPTQTGFLQPGQPQQQQHHQQQQQQQQHPSFLQPQITGWAHPNSAGNQMNVQSSPWGGMQQQQTGMQQQPPSMLQPQATGPNPFRQSMMLPQMAGFGGQPSQRQQSTSPVSAGNSSGFMNGVSGMSNSNSMNGAAAAAKPLTAQPTGSKNPFAPQPGTEVKTKAPEGPSLFELSLLRSGLGNSLSPSQPPPDQEQQPSSSQLKTPTGGFISDLASAFAIGDHAGQNGASGASGLDRFGGLSFGGTTSPNATGAGATSFASAFGTGNSNGFIQPQVTGYAGSSVKPFQPDNSSSFMQSQATGFAGSSVKPFQPDAIGSSNFLKPQQTGFAGSAVKPFKPASNFGSSLVDSLPPVSSNNGAQSSTGQSQSPPPMQANQTGFNNPFASSNMNGGQTQGGPGGNAHSDFMQSLSMRQ